MRAISQQNFIQQLSIDCVIFGYKEGNLQVLIPKLNLIGGFWALPSGFIFQHESIDQAAQRILEERTGIKEVFLDQFRVFGEAQRTNSTFFKKMLDLNQEKLGEVFFEKEDYDWITKRFVSIGYYALVDINKVNPRTTELDHSINWYDIKELPEMILDHNQQVQQALEMLRINFDYKLIWFNLLPEKFTMKELQKLYEVVFDKPFRRNNFQKKMLDLDVLERLEKKFTGAANKAPFLYRFKK
ncbi:NUDIX hydrolase [Chondrinema litorale]|uniref:NUDIX hydrolase n=1 Tax=Chondrinema litorale TaxID=2994555 RepID=UPI0025438C4D|nr:NUDIX domain-containing protein [Chondrinema litorale]UZR96505.1 NUDIX domain-containing protein [Chondrinema litorale]